MGGCQPSDQANRLGCEPTDKWLLACYYPHPPSPFVIITAWPYTCRTGFEIKCIDTFPKKCPKSACHMLCRWVCKHYGKQRPSQVSKRTGKRPNQQTFASNCQARIYVAYSKEIQVQTNECMASYLFQFR